MIYSTADDTTKGKYVKRMGSHKIVALLTAPFLSLPLLVAPAAMATPAGDNVVINEVYVRGGNATSIYPDFIELYNPTTATIDLTGMSLQYFSASGTAGNGVTPLSGSIEPGGYYLVTGSGGAAAQPLEADATGSIAASASKGSVVLFNVAEKQTLANPADTTTLANVVDAVGFGSGGIKETDTAKGSTNDGTSYNRTNGVDTDNNANDFVIAAVSPTKSGAAPTEPPIDPEDPPVIPEEPPAQPAELSIAEIQGDGAATPYEGKQVTTTGIVTAVYATGGFNGVVIQTPGEQSGIPTASNAIFVYGSSFAKAAKLGDYVQVTGTATEYSGKTQISSPSWTVLENPEGLSASAVTVETFPAEETQREALESMLVQVTGTHTITDNYSANRYGEIFITAGTEPLYQPSELFNPATQAAEIAAYAEANAAKTFSFDDGMSWDYTKFNQDNDAIPLAWFNVNDPARVGAQVIFDQPMIFDFLRETWKLQPTGPVNVAGGEDNSAEWVTYSGNERPAAPGDFADAGADVTVSSFNVLNYFISLGEDAVGTCKAYQDRDGNPITTNDCGDFRGAFRAEDQQRQQTKIVAAINALDSSVIGLEEIENTKTTQGADRDLAIKTLVEALNADAGFEKWAYVPSPADVPADEDVIRLAFIYQPAEVAPVGDSKILVGNADFTGLAREPLAQEWQAVGASGQPEGETFVVSVNHFKSKGSLSDKYPNDADTYAGNNNILRTHQADELQKWLAAEYPGKATLIIGDLNSYGKEDPILKLEENGYTNLADRFNITKKSYLYGGVIGSLDHGLANEAALELTVGADIWNVNAMEPLAFEYSRYNYNVSYESLFDTTAYRSSDHDPIKIALKTLPAEPTEVTPVEPTKVTPVAPTADDEADTYTIPEVEGVQYLVNGEVVEPGTYSVDDADLTVVVTAEAASSEYVLASEAIADFSLKFTKAVTALEDDATSGGSGKEDGTSGGSGQEDATSAGAVTPTEPTPVGNSLAKTGADVAAVLGFAVLLILGGSALVYRRREI